MDLGLDANGQSQPQVKNLHSLKCWKKVLFVVLNHCSSNLDVPMNRINVLGFSYPGHWDVSGVTQFHLSRKRTETKTQVCLLCRFLSVCVVVGLGLLHVSDSAVDRHLLQAPRQSHPALLRMGARHHCYGHQQVCVCVFSLLKEKEQLSRVCTSQRLVCMMTHPLNKLRHLSTYTLRSPWAWRPYRGASRKQITVPLTLSHSLLSTISAADITDPHRL